MIKRGSLSLFSCVPLMVLMFWQGSSCNSTKANRNSAPSDNHSMNNNSTRQSSNVNGTWGAQGIAMEVTDNGAEISYDCAHGSITEKIVPDAQGHFSARGLHVREHPGPIRRDEDRRGQPATYRGSVSGDTMTLTVILSDSKETVGAFTLTYGKSGRVRRCG
ncbi:MAG TPA: hypothetical protein VN920_17495 [Pyrinomonadaceae bacterium]|nr:hypothetical protein [Pyrinomonadaceae bacterium]